MVKKKSFGSLIRESRIKNGFGQRELATKIGVAASYLNDIEKEKRSAPKQIVINKLSKFLKININTLNDLAGISKGNVAPDIGEYIENNPRIVSLIRSIKENNLDEEQIETIENSLNKNNLKKNIKKFLSSTELGFLEVKVGNNRIKNLPRPSDLIKVKNKFLK